MNISCSFWDFIRPTYLLFTICPRIKVNQNSSKTGPLYKTSHKQWTIVDAVLYHSDSLAVWKHLFPQQMGVLGTVVYSLVPLTNLPEEAGVTLPKSEWMNVGCESCQLPWELHSEGFEGPVGEEEQSRRLEPTQRGDLTGNPLSIRPGSKRVTASGERGSPNKPILPPWDYSPNIYHCCCCC